MAFRFRNTIRLAPGIRLNLGKRGISLSAGVRGASVTLGKNGFWGNVDAPGTGMSYRTRLSGSPSHQRRAQREQQRQNNHAASSAPELTAFKAMLNERGQVSLVDQDGQPFSASQRRIVWSDYADRMTTWLQSEMDAINGDMDLLLEIHQDEEYARHVHGIILRLAGVVLGLLPGIERVVVSGYSQRLDSATGHINDDYLLSVAIDKARFAELNFEQLEQVEPIAALERFDLRREMTKTGIFRPVTPIEPL